MPPTSTSRESHSPPVAALNTTIVQGLSCQRNSLSHLICTPSKVDRTDSDHDLRAVESPSAKGNSMKADWERFDPLKAQDGIREGELNFEKALHFSLVLCSLIKSMEMNLKCLAEQAGKSASTGPHLYCFSLEWCHRHRAQNSGKYILSLQTSRWFQV